MPSAPGFAVPQRVPPGVAEDAISALINLGYRRPEAQPMVARTIERLGDAAPLDAVIRDSLKELAQKAPG
jgi:holliday junction DNA helicase RuvA